METSNKVGISDKRQEIYRLLEQIPESGLEELKQLMQDIIEFYSTLSIEHKNTTMEDKVVKGTISLTVVRPEFPIQVEDIEG